MNSTLKKVLSQLILGILAGILISIGGCIFLACDDKYIGALLFCVALLFICYLEYTLFTGKVGFMLETCTKDGWTTLLVGLLGNLIGTVVFGYLLRYAIGGIGDKAYAICSLKLELSIWQVLIKGVMCGMLMYIAVFVFKKFNKNVIGILFCIPTFILAGFEHSIADMFYFATSGIVSFDAFIFLLIVIIVNAVGGLLLPTLKMVVEKLK